MANPITVLNYLLAKMIADSHGGDAEDILNEAESYCDAKHGDRSAGYVQPFAFRDALLFAGVPDMVATSWLAIRGKKKQVNTEYAFRDLEHESAAVGISVPQAVEFAVQNGWARFKSEWWLASGKRPNTDSIPETY